MNTKATPKVIRRTCALGRIAGLVLAGLAVPLCGCRGEIPASLKLTVMTGPGAPAAESLRVRVFDTRGVAHDDARFSAPAPTDFQLGTLVIYPRSQASLALRVQVQGLVGDAVVSEATLAAVLVDGQQLIRSIVLMGPARPADRDGDEVPDDIDNCPAFFNPGQADGDGDGQPDDCRLSMDAGMDRPGGDAGAPDADGEARPPGAACTAAADCTSGHCVDGLCCESACADSCGACNVAGSEGRCTPIAAGQPDPRGRCPAEAPESCGRDGTCNGAGACRLHRVGTMCGVPSCASSTERVLPALCDGKGTCQPPRTQSCAPYRCADAECRTSCSGAQDCAGGSACVNGSCGRKPLGAPCTTGTDCNSSSCVDGVCCDTTDCTGPCRTCNLPGAEGSCRNLLAGAEPRTAGCAMEAPSTCGRTGKCDGAGACQLYPAGSFCQARTCTGSTEAGAASCTGTGACIPGTTRSCGIYACSGDTCAVSCTTDAHCTTGYYCGGRNMCRIRQANGEVCTESRECASGFCVLGRCCATATCL
jgi:hypothetical protein